MSLHKFYQAIDGDFEAAWPPVSTTRICCRNSWIRFLTSLAGAELNDALSASIVMQQIKAVHTLTGQGTQLWLYTAGKKSAAPAWELRGNQG